MFENEKIVNWDRCEPAFAVKNDIIIPINITRSNIYLKLSRDTNLNTYKVQKKPLTPQRSPPSGKIKMKKIQINESENEIVEFKKSESSNKIGRSSLKKNEKVDSYGYS